MVDILKNLLNQLKEIKNDPHLFMYEHFAQLKNRIDLNTENLIINNTNNEKFEKEINDFRLNAIERIDLIQRDCLNNLQLLEIDEKDLNFKIQNIESEIKLFENDLKLGFEKINTKLLSLIKNELDRIKRYYFGNKTVFFDDLQSFFGCLVVIHGHYLNEIHHDSIKYLAFFHFY